jgi:hypothetical protein
MQGKNRVEQGWINGGDKNLRLFRDFARKRWPLRGNHERTPIIP